MFTLHHAAILEHGEPEDGSRKPLDGVRREAHNGPMPLPDRATCVRIFASRDARYDGRLFVGVKTTGVYCRPICRVRAPKPVNCVYFTSAAAAQAAGFRSCLRCRPETAPTLWAWNGTSTTVDRALGLIASGALDDEQVGGLATRLGIGERHLRRLFAEHLVAYVPLAALIKRVLDERPNHRARVARFSEELEDFMSEDYAEETLKAVVDWCRFAELFVYDEADQSFSLEAA